MSKRVYYSGDVNLEYGGVFYSLANAQYGYASAVRVTPLSDAGGPDNQFWIEPLTINFKRDALQTKSMLACIGLENEPAPNAHVLIDAALAYGFYDQEAVETVQIGAASGLPAVDTVLRANASLRRYVWKNYCAYGALE